MFAKDIKDGESLPGFDAMFNIYAADKGKASSIALADGLNVMQNVNAREISVPLSYEVMQHAAEMAVIHTGVPDLTPSGIGRIKAVYDRCRSDKSSLDKSRPWQRAGFFMSSLMPPAKDDNSGKSC